MQCTHQDQVAFVLECAMLSSANHFILILIPHVTLVQALVALAPEAMARAQARAPAMAGLEQVQLPAST